MGIHVEFILFHGFEPERVSGKWTGGPPLSQSGAPCWPGGDCFAPYFVYKQNHLHLSLWSIYIKSADLTLVRVRCLEHLLGGGRRPSPPEDFSGLVRTYDFSSSFTALIRKVTFLCWRHGGGWVSRWRLNARAFSFGKTSTFASLELRSAFS